MSPTPPARPRGRPVTGGTPDNVRALKARAALAESGGGKVCSPVPAAAMDDFQAICTALGYSFDVRGDSAPRGAKQEAIVFALRAGAKAVARKAPK